MSQRSRPNLLYIHSDQHNAAVTGCYGDAQVHTPHLDRLAQGGAHFTSNYCCSPICVPSRMATLSGRHPWQNEVWSNSHVLNSNVPTLAHSMGIAGYRPALIGRMHAVGPDQLHGYCERLVGDHSPNFPGIPTADRGALQGTAGPERISIRHAGVGQSGYQVHDEAVTAAAVDWLNRLGVRRRAGVDDAPFSLSVGYMLPHPPYVARRADYDRHADSLPPPRKPRDYADEAHPYLRRWRETTGLTDVDAGETRRARAAYWGLVEAMDAMIGEVLAALAANDLERDTLVVYSSDHGDMVGEHGLWWKHVFYEESARVPFLLSVPWLTQTQRRIDGVSGHVDLAPTLLDLAGVPRPDALEGRSLAGALTGDLDLRQHAAFMEWNGVGDRDLGNPVTNLMATLPWRSIVTGDRWKLNLCAGDQSELFDLNDDPYEQTNRFDDPAQRDRVRELAARIRLWQVETGDDAPLPAV